MSEPPDRHRDPLLQSILWRCLGRFLFRIVFYAWQRPRQLILRACGTKLTPTSRFAPSVRIDRPWNVSFGEYTQVGENAVLRARSPITMGNRAVLSHLTTLTTEIRDATDPDHPVRTAPITVGDHCWIATDSLVLPGVTIGTGTVVGARALVDDDLPEWTIALGHPAEPKRKRVMRSHLEPEKTKSEDYPDDS